MVTARFLVGTNEDDAILRVQRRSAPISTASRSAFPSR